MRNIQILLLSALLLAGCNKFGDLNVNPNLPSKASNTQLIANAELMLPVLQEVPQGEFYAQYLMETLYPNLSLYTEPSASFYTLYHDPLMNLETVITKPEQHPLDGPVPNQVAVAKVLKAYFFWHITDRWGDVPYSQALKGEETFTPVYDTQESIYNNLLALLTQASGEFVAGKITNDIIYAGDPDKWKRLCNTIRLLMALRMSEVNGNKAREEFTKAVAAGIMISNGDNLVFHNLPDANNESYWYNQWTVQRREWWAGSELLVNTLKAPSDPRLAVFTEPREQDGTFVGLPYGSLDGATLSRYSLLGEAVRTQDAPVYLVTYAQALFALAEGAKRGWIPGGDAKAKEHYDEAIKQSLLQWTGSSDGHAALIAHPSVAYDPANGLRSIATQRWVHLFMHGFEAWAEWRRTGFPTLVKVDGKDVPSRQAYPSDETFNNGDNYRAAVTRQFAAAGDSQYGKVWWDKN
ncbi:SusD/RagB family nutrient-binding outer membrane lipoprotein [Chitinophaga rhizosphaerae]|uniref:SusD/RagB family nutrient-binding outer membrane lipoprotein n=1 Tax=Chitinophaga rhizosphaerae TaxID=1864947 RepID=UPI000F7FEFA6|nr:SusD/RagB family nutrient-binding outer membrane lipoprotein [Chitinophaga rhizosphaerae]